MPTFVGITVGLFNQKFEIMSDNKQNIGNPDKSRINLSEDYEVRYWSEKFGVSHEELKTAVKEVGSNPKKVEEYLKENK
jgi:hypothetical protein